MALCLLKSRPSVSLRDWRFSVHPNLVLGSSVLDDLKLSGAQAFTPKLSTLKSTG